VSDDGRPWWPPEYGEHPAFQTRRQVYGAVTGGDYVRGSSVVTLNHTALRYPTTPTNQSSIVNKAVLHVYPVDHSTMAIEWGWPPGLADTWLEVALVRAGFGRPSTPNDGQTIFRATHDVFQNADASDDPPPIVLDNPLPPGRWYQYGLFFRVDPVNWVRGMVMGALLPRDLGHEAHLWDNLPPYYQWVDDNQSVGSGPLRKFLQPFAFELDTAREFVESWQHLYDIDQSPIRLLRYLGANFGIPYESGIGDIRYRSLLVRIGELYAGRGTEPTLLKMVEQFSKYQATLSAGANLMLLPDDADFYQGIGNWAGIHNLTPHPFGTLLASSHVFCAQNLAADAVPPPAGLGRGTMKVNTATADATTNLAITCGDGITTDTPPRTITPLHGAIPVRPNKTYGFSVWVMAETMPVTVEPDLLWFDKTGDPAALVATTRGNPAGITVAGWHQYIVEAAVPANATYLVPCLLFTSRPSAGGSGGRSADVNIAGVMVWELAVAPDALVVPPDKYLTMGDPGEVVGSALTYRGTLTGAGTALPASPAFHDAYTLTPAPVPTAAPQYHGTATPRAAAVNDVIYWNGTAWINAGPIGGSFSPFLLGASSR